MSLSSKFRWDSIDDNQFEEIIYEIVKSENPTEISWRSYTGGKGRDIEAKFIIKGAFEEYIEVITQECDIHKHFEILELGIPNWSTFLSYIQAQIKLQIALVNYIFALENNASIEELQSLSEEIKERAKEITDEDESKPHWLLVD